MKKIHETIAYIALNIGEQIHKRDEVDSRDLVTNIDRLAEGFNCTKTTAAKHIDNMKKAELIRDKQFPSDNGAIVYEVFDPRILHLLSRGVTSMS